MNYDVITKSEIITDGPFILPALTICGETWLNFDDILDSYGSNKVYNEKSNLSIEFFQEIDPYNSYNCMRFNGYHNSSQKLEEEFDVNWEGGFVIDFKNVNVLLIYITDNYLNNLFSVMPFYLHPDKEAIFYFKKKVTQRLPYPYNPCDTTEPGYMQTNCIQKCVHEDIKEYLNCTFAGYYKVKAEKECDRGSSSFSNAMGKITDKCEKNCRKECDTTTFDVSFIQNERAGNIRILAHYSELSYEKTTQIPKTTSYDFFSIIGGTIGLFLGFSLLSFFEILELSVKMLFFYIKKIRI